MNLFTNLLKPEAEAAIRRAIGAIPGTSIERITAMPPANANSLRLINVRIKLMGWSPSLNEIRMAWETSIHDDVDAETQSETLLSRLEDRLAIQQARFDEAMTLGKASPFLTDLDEGRYDVHEIDHLLIDRALAFMLEDADGTFHEVGDGLYVLHIENCDRDGDVTHLEAEITPEHNQPSPGMQALHGRVFTRDFNVTEGVVYNGRTLRIKRNLPETAISAAVGRTVGEVVDGIPLLAGHRILSVDQEDGECIITVEPDLVGVGDHLDAHGRRAAA